jgi:hypothetical protein
MNSIATILCISTYLRHTIKNERLESIDPLHLLHKCRGPGSSVDGYPLFELPKSGLELEAPCKET